MARQEAAERAARNWHTDRRAGRICLNVRMCKRLTPLDPVAEPGA